MAMNKMEAESKNQELKHLGFVRIAAIQALVCVSNLYEHAKRNSGPLRSSIGTVESTASSVIGPVYDKFKGFPLDVLVFVDTKPLDEATQKFEEHAPPSVKQVASQAKGLFQKVTHKAEKVVDEARSGGPRAAVHYTAIESKQFLLTGSVKLWAGLNHYPPFHAAAEMAVTNAAHLVEKYNDVIRNMNRKGYTVFGYFPLIPIDDIAKAFKQPEANIKNDEAATPLHKSESSDSDSE